MPDLITRLLLNTQQFDQNLGKSSQLIQGFQKNINTFSTGAIGAFTKFTGAVGLAMGGMEAFKTTIGSTQTTGDAFDQTILNAKSSIDLFFTSIAKGDFSKFIDGLKDAIIKSGILAGHLDELATKSLFTNKELSDLMLQKKIQDNIAKDKTKSDAERNAALKESRKTQIDINNLSSKLAKQEKDTGYALLNSAIAELGFKGKVSNSMWDSVTNESNRGKVQAGAAEYDRRKAEIDKETTIKKVGGGAGGGSAIKIVTEKGVALQKEFDKWIKTTDGQTKLFYKNFLEIPDGDKSKLSMAVQHFKNANNLIGNISDSEFELNKIDSRINGDYNSNNKPVAEESKAAVDNPLVGSIAYDRELLIKYQKKLEEATDEDFRKVFRNIIHLLELNIQRKLSGNEEGEEGKTELTPVTKPSRQTRDTFYDYKKSDVDKLKEELELSKAYLEELKDAYKDTADQMQDELSNAMSNVTSLEDALKIATVKKDIEELSKSLNDSLYGGIKDMASSSDRVVSAFSNLRSVFEDVDSTGWDKIMAVWNTLTTSADSILSVIDTINKVTELVNKLTAAKQAGAVVDTAVTATEVANAATSATTTATTTAVELAATTALTAEYSALAAAKTFAAHAFLPFIGTGIASGLIATQQAIINAAKLPKFCNGGIIGGSSFIGDNMIARVNSGEMILNGTQQRNLFNLLDGKGNVAGSSGEVVFKIAGKDLVGTLNNQMSKTNKYK